MSRQAALVIPAGTTFEVAEGSLRIRHDGDVSLGWAPPNAVLDIECSGNLTLSLPNIQGRLRAAGRMDLTGRIDVDRLEAAEIVIGPGEAKARAVCATTSIRIGPAKIAFDAVIAPDVSVDPGTHGRITLLDCQNELGASKIKGCLSPADYADMIGDPADFVASRGAVLLSVGPHPSPTPAPPPPPTQAAAAARTPAPAPARVPSHSPAPAQPRRVAVAVPAPPQPAPRVVPPMTPIPAPIRVEEDVGDPPSLAVDEMEPISESGVDGNLVECIRRIRQAYDGGEVPPMVTDLERLVVRRDHDAIRREINGLFTRLSEWHVKNGVRPIQSVTAALNTIHTLVQDASERF